MREFGSVKLASWLCEKNIKFILRIKQGRYIPEQGKEFKRLIECGLVPGTSFYLPGVKVTKQKGFGLFDVAGYWQRKYRDSGEDEGWYLLTNIGTLKQAVTAFKCPSGIEAMFKDCKTGGYNLEKSYACDDRLKTLILLIALAYSCAILLELELERRSPTQPETSATSGTDLSEIEPAGLLNQLKSRRKKSRADLADVEAILEILLS